MNWSDSAYKLLINVCIFLDVFHVCIVRSCIGQLSLNEHDDDDDDYGPHFFAGRGISS